MIENLKPLYWFWENALPPKLCDLILEEVKSMELQRGKVGLGDDDARLDDILRSSDVAFMPDHNWLQGAMLNYGGMANHNAGWNFNVNTAQAVQIARYADGGHYDWHVDSELLDVSAYVRKITVIAAISDPETYEGGEFELRYSNMEPVTVPLKRGTILAFPSAVVHRVAPVTQGERYSATCWITGPATY